MADRYLLLHGDRVLTQNTTKSSLFPTFYLYQRSEMDGRFQSLAKQFAGMTPENHGERTAYNFAFGALHAFARAKELNLRETKPERGTSKQRTEEVRRIAGSMATSGYIVQNGPWLAGFYYNDVLLRCDVCYEHLLRYWTRKRGHASAEDLIQRAKKSNFKEVKFLKPWLKIRKQVNLLKHRYWEFPDGPRRVLPSQAFEIVSSLVCAVEWSLKNRALRSKRNVATP